MWLLLSHALADEVVYGDDLGPAWQSWSWSATVDFGATDVVHTGAAAMAVHLDGYGALSLHRDSPFTEPALRFWVEGDGLDLALLLEADGEGYAADPIPLSTWATPRAGTWTEVVVDLTPFGAHSWTRIDLFQNGAGAVDLHVDDVELLGSLPDGAPYLGAEPVGARSVVVYGTGDGGAVTLSLDGVPLGVSTVTSLTDPDRSLLTLSDPLAAGTLSITAGDQTWTRTLRSTSATLDLTPGRPISDAIYGVAFADADWVDTHGPTVVRWGGNATTLYNPATDTTNLAADWYFENAAADDAGEWVRDVAATGAAPFLSVPALDWVARDDTACSYAVSTYGAQGDTDPWRPDCGNGVTRAGVEITWNDPADVGAPWSPAAAAAWLATLPVAPTYAAIDNELDIASSTHRDVHPEPVTYDELFDRWYTMAGAVKDTLPGTAVMGPSSCCWWFYWNSAEGEADKAAHGGEDLLPWWLAEVAAADAAAGRRTLDYLDIHYYPNDVFNDDTSDAVRAERLRSTRSLWDPTYTDEGWIGTDVWATQTQPDRNQVQLLPRFRALVDGTYPGTRLAIGEWNWGAERDLSGGLAIADVLGIFGREGLDLATYWTTPPEGSPAAEAFRLYRGAAPPFGDTSLAVAFTDPDHLGVYAATAGERTTVVVVNKDPDQDLVLDLAGLPTGDAAVRHFSTTSEGRLVDDGTLPGGTRLVVPAYGALFLAVGAPDGDTGGPTDTAVTDTADPTDTDPGDTEDGLDSAAPDAKPAGGCGCAAGGPPGGGLLGGLLLAALTRRRSARR